MSERSDTERLKEALRLVLAFHEGGPWTAEKRLYWKSRTGADEATTRVLCDEIRIRLGVLPSAFGDFKGRIPSALPPDLPLTKEQESIVWRIEQDAIDAALDAEEKEK